MGLGQAREISGQLDALCSQGWRNLPNAGLHAQRAGARMVGRTTAASLGLSACTSVLTEALGGRGRLLREDRAPSGIHGLGLPEPCHDGD